jgi:GUN4-like
MYFMAALLIAVFTFWSAFLQWLPTVIKVLIGAMSLLAVIHLFRLSYNISNSFMKESSSSHARDTLDRGINISAGNYTESLNIQGDYIQGDKNVNVFKNFNFGQDFSGTIEEIRNILDDLTQKYGNREYAQQKVIDDLAFAIRQNNSFKDQMDSWLKTHNFESNSDETEIAEKIIDLATETRKNFFWKTSIESEKSKRKYRKLVYLLKTAQWREADEETVSLIEKLMPSPKRRYGCSNIDVAQITPRELKTINKIWLEASGGRFGFSVQKRVWHRIKNLDSNGYLNIGKTEYDVFAEAVGWSNDMSRIYHADFDYQIANPQGYLPAKILLLETYDPNSKYCSLSACLFDEFLDREYSDFSFLPHWLREWLLLD